MGKRKFKVGDKVIFLDGSKLKHGNWMVSSMKQYVGKIGVIDGVASCYENWCSYAVKGGGDYCWPDTFLKKVPETIVIYRKDDKTVVAIDKSTGKEAVAKCNPEDEFDFNVGAKIAFERLVGDKKEDKKEDSAIKVGDIVKVVDWGCCYSTNYAWFDKFKGELEPRWMICYAYDDHRNYNRYRSRAHSDNSEDMGRYVVLFVGDDKALITRRIGYELGKGTVSDSVYLVGVDGLEVVYSKNSAEDTSEKKC